MRQVALVLALAILTSCSAAAEPPELVTAYCNNGAHVIASRERAERFCAGRRGVASITLLPDEATPPDGNAS